MLNCTPSVRHPIYIFYMFCIQFTLVLFISDIILIDYSNSLEEPTINSAILTTEAIIRNTVNKLFSALKLKRKNDRLNEYLVINKFFAFLTLEDHETLNKLINISRINNKSTNSSAVFMTAINELLKNDNQKIEEIERNNDMVTSHVVKTILNTLKKAKELNNTDSYVKINENILKLSQDANKSNTTQAWQNMHDVYDVNQSYDLEFWTPSGRRIYKGERTKIKHYPFMASIQVFNNFQCAGSIIKSDLIITASSCLQLAWNNRFYRENPAFLSVRVGSSFYNGGGEVIPVLEVYFYPDYNPKNLKNNICLLRLTRRIKFSWRARRRVRKIDIDRHANDLPVNTPGITILGWGAKGRSNIVRDPWQNVLSLAVLDVYPLRDCQDVYSKKYVTRNNFCAGFMSKGGGACNRDIGGPGIHDGILVGVVSFGSPVCGAADAPTVFTKLGYYADWIDGIMQQEVPYSKKKTTVTPTQTPYGLPVKYFPKSTTIKIPPLSETKTYSIPVNDEDNVLNLFDEKLFKEFLKTMFDNKEMLQYQDVFKEFQKEMDHNRDEKNYKQLHQDEIEQVTSPNRDIDAQLTTRLIEYEEDIVETATQTDYPEKYTVMEDETNSKSDEANLEEENVVEESLVVENKHLDKNFDKSHIDDKNLESIFIEDINLPDFDKKNESVLTLLYLSDENKNNDEDFERSEQSSEEAKGLSISSDAFLDLTRSKGEKKYENNVYLHNELPEKELYEILSEIIDEEMRNNKTR